jgi:predicted nucleic acid-binding protein
VKYLLDTCVISEVARKKPDREDDGLLAATALENGLTLVTRDVSHMEAAGVDLFDPWEG